MPLVLVGANVEGKPNFMPAAFVGIANFKPPVIGCGLSPSHLTAQAIERDRAFSINIPSAEQVVVTDYCGLHSGKQVDKSDLFETFTGTLESAPMIRSCRLTAECRLIQTIVYAVDTLFLGEVVSVYADEEILVDDKPDWSKVAPLLFTFPDGNYWNLGGQVAKAWNVGRQYAK